MNKNNTLIIFLIIFSTLLFLGCDTDDSEIQDNNSVDQTENADNNENTNNEVPTNNDENGTNNDGNGTNNNNNVPSNNSDNVTNNTVPTNNTDNDTNNTVPTNNTDNDTNNTVPTNNTDNDTNNTVPTNNTDNDTNNTVPTNNTDNDTNNTVPTNNTDNDTNNTVPTNNDTNSEYPVDTLAVECSVPYLLDDELVTNMDMNYLISHLSDMVSEYCITGIVKGVDIASFPYKSYFGTHSNDLDEVYLIQSGRNGYLGDVKLTTRVQFAPDSKITDGTVWPVRLNTTPVEGEALALVVEHISDEEVCCYGIGTAGELKISDVVNDVTVIGDGQFKVTGTIDIADPHDIADICELFAGDSELPNCCE